MRNHARAQSSDVQRGLRRHQRNLSAHQGELPNRLMTAAEVADVHRLPRRNRSPRILARPADIAEVRCQEPAFSSGDVLDWIGRGAPTRVS